MDWRLALFGLTTPLTLVVVPACGGDEDGDPGGNTGGAGASGGSGTGSGPTSGGSAATEGEAGAGAGVQVDDCAGIPLIAAGVLDLNIPAISVAGTVTLNGAPLPESQSTRGALVFQETGRGGSLSMDLGSTGAGAYAVTLAPGIYDVVFAANPALCGALPAPAMPCTGKTLVSGLSLTANGVLDVDIPAIQVTGNVTFKGGIFPDDPAERGSIALVEASGQAAIFPLGAAGAVSFGLTLVPGVYDVQFRGNPAGCEAGTPSLAPCNDGVLLEDLSLTATGVLDVDVPAVRVSGQVLVNSAVVPDAPADRGNLTFQHATGGEVRAAPFGAAGGVSYAVTLLPGTYAVGYTANPSLCTGPTPGVMPCTSAKVMKDLTLTADGVLDVDLPAVSITGSVLLNSGILPDDVSDRGALQFTRADGGVATFPSLGSIGPGAYAVTLLPGDYSVEFVPDPLRCTAPPLPPLPCLSTPVGTLPANANGVYDVNIPRIRVSGSVLLNGGPLVDLPFDRGALSFEHAAGGTALTPTFGAAGAVTYAMHLAPGVYDIGYVPNEACASADAVAVPCNAAYAHRRLELTADGVLDVDLKAVAVGGTVLLNGQPLPAASADRGALTFTLVGAGSAAVGLGSTDPGTYQIALWPGPYAVAHAANPGLCGPGLASPFPCNTQILLGCE